MPAGSLKLVSSSSSSKTYTEADAGKTFSYTITEVNDGQTGYTYDSHVCDVTVTVTDNGDGTLSCEVKLSDEGTTFTNPYEPLAVKVNLKGTKTLEGKTLAAGEFSFELADETGAVIKTVTNDASGNIDFGSFLFEEEGTFTYTATEVAGSDKNMTYDSAKHVFTIEVTDDNGQLVAKVSSDEGDAAKFTNKYTAEEPPAPKPMPITGDNLPIVVLVAIAIAAAAVCAVAARRRTLAIKAERRANHGYYGRKR